MTVVCSEAYLALKNICILFQKWNPSFALLACWWMLAPSFPCKFTKWNRWLFSLGFQYSSVHPHGCGEFFKKMFARLTCILHSRKLALKLSYGNHLDCIVLSQKYANHGIQSMNQRGKKETSHIFKMVICLAWTYNVMNS